MSPTLSASILSCSSCWLASLTQDDIVCEIEIAYSFSLHVCSCATSWIVLESLLTLIPVQNVVYDQYEQEWRQYVPL